MDAPSAVVMSVGGLRVELRKCGPVDAEALCDWCDHVLPVDYFFKRRHMVDILTRSTSCVYAIFVDGVVGGVVILYRESVLHNLYLKPEYRGSGVGAAVVSLLRPLVVRAKTNMAAGDPRPFYAGCGYVQVGVDVEKPHIAIMERVAVEEPRPGRGACAGGACAAPPIVPRSVIGDGQDQAGDSKPAPVQVSPVLPVVVGEQTLPVNGGAVAAVRAVALAQERLLLRRQKNRARMARKRAAEKQAAAAASSSSVFELGQKSSSSGNRAVPRPDGDLAWTDRPCVGG